jgi:uncharacterized cupin superfamily protein
LGRRTRHGSDRAPRLLGRRGAPLIANWNDVEGERLEQGHLCGTWFDLGEASGTEDVGVTRIQIEPNRWSTPAHVELDEEEIFFVLAGLSWQDGKTYEVRAGDCIVHRVAHEAHTLCAGDEGLDVLAFGERTNATATYLPRAKVLRMGPTVDASQGLHPWEREAAAGAPELPEPSARPSNVLNVDDADVAYDGDAGRWIRFARQACAKRTGLNWGRLNEGRAGAPPHCHSEDEEIFVILEGRATLELWPSPERAKQGREKEAHDVRAGDVISRPASTGMAHYFRAGAGGMTFLAYGTNRRNDICYYPRSNKISWRGIGLIARLEPLDYDDGEPED